MSNVGCTILSLTSSSRLRHVELTSSKGIPKITIVIYKKTGRLIDFSCLEYCLKFFLLCRKYFLIFVLIYLALDKHLVHCFKAWGTDV